MNAHIVLQAVYKPNATVQLQKKLSVQIKSQNHPIHLSVVFHVQTAPIA